MTANITELPKNVRRFMRLAHLSSTRIATKLEVTQEGKQPLVINLDKRQLQKTLTLMHSPLYCAIPVRLNDVVHIIKSKHGLIRETLCFNDSNDPIASAFSVDVLNDKFRVLPSNEVAT